MPASQAVSLELHVPLHRHKAQERPDAVVFDLDPGAPADIVQCCEVAVSQNDEHKTTVCAYSLRAKDRPTVSMPVRWDEVESADPARLAFEADRALARIEEEGDLFAPLLSLKQKLPRLH